MQFLPTLMMLRVVATLEVIEDDGAPSCGVEGVPPSDTVWTDVLQLGVRGRGWPESQLVSPYSRLPATAKSLLCSQELCASSCTTASCESLRCDVWALAQTATGLSVQFATTAEQVHVRWTMMPENGDELWALGGHSGIDFYVQDWGGAGGWRWAVASANNAGNAGGSMSATMLQSNGTQTTFTSTLGVMASTAVPRNFTLYLPSRGTTLNVAVGVAPGELLTPLPSSPSHSKPLAL